MASHASVSARPMWGLTVTGPRQSETIERALAVGLFDTVEATWNLLERSATRALERAAIRGRRYQTEDSTAAGGARPARCTTRRSSVLRRPPFAVEASSRTAGRK